MAIRKVDAAYIQKEYIAPIHYEKLNSYLQSMLKTIPANAMDKSVQRVVRDPNKSFPYIVSFRKTGKYSVLMLNCGAAAKPHDILDKTIKETSINSVEKGCKQLLLLYGLVARRRAVSNTGSGNSNELKEIDALYLAPDKATGAIGTCERGNDNLIKFIAKATGISEKRLLEVGEMSEDNILKSMADPESDLYAGNYAGQYIAGDYDIHDLISKITQPHPVPEGSVEEIEALNHLNQVMMQGEWGRPKGDMFIKEPRNPIQHGSQYNYVAHMCNEEPDAKIVESVAMAALPVLMLNFKDINIEWVEIETLDDLRKYYDDNFVNMKNTWKEDFPAYIVARQCRKVNELHRDIRERVRKQKGY